MNSDTIDMLKNKIISFNEDKNRFVVKKLNGEITKGSNEERSLISSLMYIIAEVRKLAISLGIKETGEITVENVNVEKFKYINEATNNLKKQIMHIVSVTPEELKDEINKKKENEDEKNKKNGKDEKKVKRIDRLKEKLNC